MSSSPSRSLPFLTRHLRRLLTADGASSAVEFALIAPLLAVLAIGTADIGKIAFDRTDMFSAARSGAQYFMSGGSDLERARYVITSAWTKAPEDAIVVIDRFCRCDATEHACNTPCPDDSAPDAFARINLQGTVRGVFLGYENLASDTVRIR
jgi:Flp pilus assembly pilin Flp